MKAATLLIILLSHGGYWFGDQEQTVSVQWKVSTEMPASQLQWELMFGQVRISGDKIAMQQGSPTIVKLKLPPANARTQLRWVYHVTDSATGKELDSGEQTINMFPPVPLGDIAARIKSKKLFVMDDPGKLPRILADAKVDAVRIDDPSALQSAQADIVLVGPDQLHDAAIFQSMLLAQAQAGAQVLIFEQKQPSSIGGYTLSRKAMNSSLTWWPHHPLWDGFTDEDLAAWAADIKSDVYAMQLPADEPALELAYWPRESPGKTPVPIDALIAVKAIGKGRVIYCQFPMDDWAGDPRNELFLYNALNYLLTRPQPTPPPSQRPTTRSAETPAVADIKINGE